jgi:anti-anti-sigma regulatory factor
MNSDVVYTASVSGAAWLKVIGRGTFANSHQIKKHLQEKIDSGCPKIIIELKECLGMDSTFMGILTGLSIRLKGLGHEPIILANISAHNVRLLETLGLNKFLDIKENFPSDNSLQWEMLPIEILDKYNATKHMLSAHKELIDTGGLASQQFKSVHQLLKEDLERQMKRDAKKQ